MSLSQFDREHIAVIVAWCVEQPDLVGFTVRESPFSEKTICVVLDWSFGQRHSMVHFPNRVLKDCFSPSAVIRKTLDISAADARAAQEKTRREPG